MVRRERWRILAVAAAMDAAGYLCADPAHARDTGAADAAVDFARKRESRIRRSRDYRFALRLASGTCDDSGSFAGARRHPRSESAYIHGPF